jgi:hypothetical protein
MACMGRSKRIYAAFRWRFGFTVSIRRRPRRGGFDL